MNAVLGKKENNKVEFSFEIPEKDFKKGINEAYKKNRKYFQIPGFRKGKAPRQIIEMNYGVEIFYEDALNEVLPKAYEEAVEELGLEPVGTPEVDVEEIKKGEAVIVNIKVDVKPEVKLGNYKEIEIEKADREVSEEVIEAELKTIQDMNGRIVDAGDRPVEEGDIVTIDYSGSVDGEKFEGGTAEDYDLEIGAGHFIDGFEDQLVGKKTDEEVEVKVTFPESYHEKSLQGKDAIFIVNIKQIKTKELPELDDEFAKDISEFDTLEEYKEDLRKNLEKAKNEEADIAEENAMIEAIIDDSEVDIPESMIEEQVGHEVSEFSQRLAMQGLNIEQYYQLTSTDESALEDQLRPAAIKRLQGDLILSAIGEKEEITVTEEERIEELKEMAEQYGQEDVDKFIEDMKKGDLTFLDQALINRKVIDLLKENVKFS